MFSFNPEPLFAALRQNWQVFVSGCILGVSVGVGGTVAISSWGRTELQERINLARDVNEQCKEQREQLSRDFTSLTTRTSMLPERLRKSEEEATNAQKKVEELSNILKELEAENARVMSSKHQQENDHKKEQYLCLQIQKERDALAQKIRSTEDKTGNTTKTREQSECKIDESPKREKLWPVLLLLFDESVASVEDISKKLSIAEQEAQYLLDVLTDATCVEYTNSVWIRPGKSRASIYDYKLTKSGRAYTVAGLNR